MKSLVILALVGVACAAPSYGIHGAVSVTHAHAPVAYAHAPVAVAPIHPPASYISKYHAQDELGQVSYGFAHPGQAKSEYRDAYGNVVGSYSYIGEDNKPVVVYYTAGKNGFQVRSNALPTGPAASTDILPVAPSPVMDTPEVIAAKEAFEAAFAAAAAAAEAGTLPELVVPEGVPSPVMDTPEEVAAAKENFQAAYEAAAAAAAIGAVPEVVLPLEPVMDTAEVAEAKAQFQAAYDAAAAAAEAAPDYDLDGSLSRYSGYLSAVDGALSPLYTNTIPFGAYGVSAPLVHAKLPVHAHAHVVHAHGPVVHAHAHGHVAHSHPVLAPLHFGTINYGTPYKYVHA
ncbi:uncharacterized protein LOC143034696 [Oratosquilla oratoria]|uniref:uncharacterized protein LOC143034696 n=1 Tax=Oratosquilla oratoria TaxID=337810 RepID=UPI003F762645